LKASPQINGIDEHFANGFQLEREVPAVDLARIVSAQAAALLEQGG
jgi:hypothetical protein